MECFDTVARYPCTACGSLTSLEDMSKKFVCVTCVGRATIASGRHSARVRRIRRQAAEGATALEAKREAGHGETN